MAPKMPIRWSNEDQLMYHTLCYSPYNMDYHIQVNITPNIIKSLNFFTKIEKSDKKYAMKFILWVNFPTYFFQFLIIFKIVFL